MRLSHREAVALGLIPAEPGGGVDRRNRPRYTRKTPEQALWESLWAIYGAEVERNFRGAVPGRRFRIDVAFPRERLAIEVDGWRHHSSVPSFTHDRERQNLLALHHWAILRYTARQVFREMGRILDEVALAREQRGALSGGGDDGSAG